MWAFREESDLFPSQTRRLGFAFWRLPREPASTLTVTLPHIVRAARKQHAVPHQTISHTCYLAAAREVAERPSDRRAGLVLPAVRKLALLAALWTRGARVFVRQSSETPGALELGMRRSSSGLRDGVARAIVSMHRSDGGVRRVCFRLVFISFWCAGEAFVPGRGTLVDV